MVKHVHAKVADGHGVLTEAYNTMPIKLWVGTEPGGSFHAGASSTQLLKVSNAMGQPIGLQSTM
jgi:hypothetical protein